MIELHSHSELDYSYLRIFSVLIRRGGDGQAEVVLLDHGLYEELSLSVRQSLCLLWKSIVLGDHPRMKKHAAELGVTGRFFFSYNM